MRPLLAAILLSLCLASLPGCGDDGESDDPVERGAAIARQIKADPESAEEILEEHEMSIEDFEALMYEIAADPEMSERYQELFEAEE
jgi:hypothetical protein